MRAAALLALLVPAVVATACGDDGSGAPDAAVDAPLADAAPQADADLNRYLSQTGLYADISTQTFASDLIAFQPRYTLWSDGAVKKRFLRLPPGTQIDTSDMDHWKLPVGAQFFKEFRAPDGTLLETRLVEHVADTGDADTDYWMGAFAWRADGSDAVFVPDGVQDVNGTDHDVPDEVKCRTCHDGEAGHALGFSAVQLSDDAPGTRLGDLVAAGLLSDPPAPGTQFLVPGDATTKAALGYIHANCGHCHNPAGAARPDVDMTLRLGTADTQPTSTPESTTVYTNLVNQPLFRFMAPGYMFRVVPGDPDHSEILYRMSTRGSRDQMPPLATEHPDPTGIAAVTAWIAALPP